MNKYYFLTSTIDTASGIDDPAMVICNKYAQTSKRNIYYGNLVAVCAIDCDTAPNITEVVYMKTEDEIRTLKIANLPDFDGDDFIRRSNT